MKRLALSLILVMMGVIASFGRGIMTFSEAQQQAYYLTDKMAYELDLTPAQYDQVYQVNLEYFLNVSGSDPWGYYWNYRNTDLCYILYDWQYGLYTSCEYFYRPIQWRRGAWYLPIWDFYSRTHFYYDRPTIWHTWRGGLWTGRHHNTPSPFIGHRPPMHTGGMRHDPHPGHNNHNGHNGYRPNGGGHQPSHNDHNGHNGYRPNGGGHQPSHNDHNGHNSYRPNGGGHQPGNNDHNGNSGYNRPNGGGHQPGNNGNNGNSGYNRPSHGGGQVSGGNRGGGFSGGNRGGGFSGGNRGGGFSGGNRGGGFSGGNRGGGQVSGGNRGGGHTGGTRSFGGGHR